MITLEKPRRFPKGFFLLLIAGFLLCGCQQDSSSSDDDNDKTTSENPSTPEVVLDTNLADSSASANTKYVMDYLANTVYGNAILTGIMDCAWSNDIDMDAKVLADTGSHTALMGFDFMELTKSDSKTWYNPNQVEKAKSWWKSGGLVTFCWHWFDPSAESANGASYKPDEISFRIPWDSDSASLDTDSEAFAQIKADLDTVAAYLSDLQDEGVVVIWRPLHEARGNYGTDWGDGSTGDAWFWWGASGPEPYIALYQYMFTYFTETKGLHNLIWLWNGQGADWYPGDDYVDIVGYDIYEDISSSGGDNHGERESVHSDLMAWCGSKKMAAISECGYIPSTDALTSASESSSVNWLYYMIWNDDDTLSDDTNTGDDDHINNNFWGGTAYNTTEDKTTNAFSTTYQIKRGDAGLNALFAKMGVSLE